MHFGAPHRGLRLVPFVTDSNQQTNMISVGGQSLCWTVKPGLLGGAPAPITVRLVR